jgi:sugar lactone lactonase YvrE
VTKEGIVSTLAGSDKGGLADGIGSAARFYKPKGIAIDTAGNFYVVDFGNSCIRKITPGGQVSTFAGSEAGFARGLGFEDGKGSEALFNGPTGIAIDRADNLYVTDYWNHSIRKITPEGEVSTFAGRATPLWRPDGIAIDGAGNLYVVDTDDDNNRRIRKITPRGEVSTLAGSGKDGSGNAALFGNPRGITVDAAGNVYVAGNHVIRKITFPAESGAADKRAPGVTVSTLAGNVGGLGDGLINAARFNGPSGIAIDAAGDFYIADTNNNRIRKVTKEGMVSTLAGSGKCGSTDGRGNEAGFCAPSGITIDTAGNLYVTSNNSVRKVTKEGMVSTLAGGKKGFADGKGSEAQFFYPHGITIDGAGNLYVADSENNRIRRITPEGEVSTIAGSGKRGYRSGRGSAAHFCAPYGIVMDAAGNFYVTDYGNNSIRKITPEGEVSTLALEYGTIRIPNPDKKKR